MSRSVWKGPFIHFQFFKKKFAVLKFLKIWSRNSVILSHFVGFNFLVHTGKIFKNLFVTRDKIGYKLGEFCTTRCKFSHKNKIKHQKLKNKKTKKK